MMRKRGQPFFFLPLFGFADETEVACLVPKYFTTPLGLQLEAGLREAIAHRKGKPSNAMAHITMRIPVKTLEFFMQHDNPRTFMREVLDAYVERRGDKKDD